MTALRVLWVLGIAGPAWSRLETPPDVERFFDGLERGVYLRLELKNGSSIQGRFSNYDEYYERIWLVPDQDEGTLFRAKSIRLSSIRHAESARPEPPKPILQAMEEPTIDLLTFP